MVPRVHFPHWRLHLEENGQQVARQFGSNLHLNKVPACQALCLAFIQSFVSGADAGHLPSRSHALDAKTAKTTDVELSPPRLLTSPVFPKRYGSIFLSQIWWLERVLVLEPPMHTDGTRIHVGLRMILCYNYAEYGQKFANCWQQ